MPRFFFIQSSNEHFNACVKKFLPIPAQNNLKISGNLPILDCVLPKSSVITYNLFIFSYETINGTAMADSDYEARKDVLVFKPGETAKHIDITIIDDDEWEENEVFFIKLSRFDYKDDSVEIGGQSVTEVTIINDDGKE